jgi:hypothetical protein
MIVIAKSSLIAKRGRYRERTHVAYVETASGSMPLLLIASEARADAKNWISRLEASTCFEPATTAAENVCTN